MRNPNLNYINNNYLNMKYPELIDLLMPTIDNLIEKYASELDYDETLMHIIIKLPTIMPKFRIDFEGKGKFTTWIFSTIRFILWNYYRKQVRKHNREIRQKLLDDFTIKNECCLI